MSAAAVESGWSLSGAAVLDPWRRRARGELPVEPRRRVVGPTPSELHLWEGLAGLDQRWQREVSTGRYRLDFYLASHRLAIEVDGSSHNGPVRRAADDERDRWHLERGVVTVRFTVDEVMRDRAGVLAEIQRRMTAVAARPLTPVPIPVAEPQELPVEVADVDAESLDAANERVEAEIVTFVGVACLTVLPVIKQRRPWSRLLSRSS